MSTVITLPASVQFNSATLTLVRSSVVLRSRYTGKRQVLSLPYALWTFKGAFIPMTPAEVAPWRSFLAQLEGQANTFRMPVPGVTSPVSGYADSGGTVNGSAQTGASLVTTGWAASALILKDGDYFKVVVGDVTSSAGGAATIAFKPALRKSPTNGQPIVFNSPTVLLSATGDDVASWDLTHPVMHAIKMDCIEAVE
jgi:hypothetical protein